MYAFICMKSRKRKTHMAVTKSYAELLRIYFPKAWPVAAGSQPSIHSKNEI
jgi:hypothetical protein